ncbi:MAG: hypothetical protein ACKOXI_02025 [Candidatus Planktophila sp.]
MIKSLSQVAHILPMINQEGGAQPGQGLTALQTVTYFVIVPLGLFVVIGGLAWISSTPKKEKQVKRDVINSIPDDNDNFITIIA